MTPNPRHFKRLGKEPGEQSPPDPVHPEDFCEEIDCESLNLESDVWECKEGYDPTICIEMAEDKETYGDMKYHRKVDEGG